jgi:hypothetical protein
MSKTTPKPASDDGARALLDRYLCPVPFHIVRTRFLGGIASPAATDATGPIDIVKGLWGGEFPEVDSLDALNELLAVLVMGLWNRLTRHQERSSPFRLVRAEVSVTTAGLARIALIRCEELDGFVDGLFGKEEELQLPERAHRGLEVLSEARAMFAAMHELARDPTKAATADDIATARRNVRELTRIGEREIHEVVLSCTRARRQALRTMPTAKRTLH